MEKTESLISGWEDVELGIDQIHVAEGANARELKKDAVFEELVASVKQYGVLEPLLVRLMPANGEKGGREVEVIAGHRRLAAAKAAKKDAVPVRILLEEDVDKQLAVIEQLRAVENIHRKELNPIEEARAIDKVLKSVGDVKTVAAMVNKPVAYVTRAAALNFLPKNVADLIAAGELTAEHGHHLMRASEKARESLAAFVTKKHEWSKKYPTIEEFQEQIAAKVENDLKKAPFTKDEAYAGEGPCTTCPQNSANQEALFDGAAAGTCTGPTCFSKKEKQFYKDFADSHGKKLEAHKFFGVVSDKGSGATMAKGFRLMSEDEVEEKAIKKLMEEKPAAFGWAVVRPGDWSERKKPWIAFTVIDPEVLPKEKRAAAEKPKERDWEAEQKKNQHFQGYRNLHLLRAADKVFNGAKPKPEHLLGIVWRKVRDNAAEFARALNVMGMYDPAVIKTEKDLANAVEKLKAPDLLRLIWITSFDTWELAKRLKDEHGVDSAKIVKAADAEAAAEWAKMETASKEKKEASDGKEKVDTPKGKK